MLRPRARPNQGLLRALITALDAVSLAPESGHRPRRRHGACAPNAEILRNRFGATAECNSLSSFTVPFGRQFVPNTAHRGVELAAFSIGATPNPRSLPLARATAARLRLVTAFLPTPQRRRRPSGMSGAFARVDIAARALVVAGCLPTPRSGFVCRASQRPPTPRVAEGSRVPG